MTTLIPAPIAAGDKGSGPSRVGVSVADIAAGMNGYTGVLEALLLRTRTRRGSAVTTSLFGSAAEMMSVPYIQQVCRCPFCALHSLPLSFRTVIASPTAAASRRTPGRVHRALASRTPALHPTTSSRRPTESPCVALFPPAGCPMPHPSPLTLPHPLLLHPAVCSRHPERPRVAAPLPQRSQAPGTGGASAVPQRAAAGGAPTAALRRD